MKHNKSTTRLILSIIFLSVIIGLVSLYFATGNYGYSMFISYLKIPIIFMLNIIPITLLIVILYLATNRLWVSFLGTSILVLVPSIINFYKTQIRNDPLVFKDLTLLSESYNMTTQFSININLKIVVAIISLIAFTLLTKKFVKTKFDTKVRLKALLVILIVTCLTINIVYLNKDIYESIENSDLINKWSQTQSFISKGFVYPFIHSLNYAFDQKPKNYSESYAKEILNSYSNDDLPTDKKVDVIAIMLEAYNDFSKFSEIEFLTDVYAPLEKLKKESYNGELVTNIFAGETVDTEWSFLTGYTSYNQFRATTNSYVHYFAKQGYQVEGSHPCYEWFYNRENINGYLGFDKYHFYENHYAALANNTIARDRILFNEIIQLHEKAKQNNKPYFSFNVTYQNHGPYSDTRTSDTKFIAKGNLSDESYNILNNYIAGINNTNQELMKLIDYYRDKEDTVIILFGDHNPWLGDNNKVYDELGINLDLKTEEGFLNYYNTPYLIWANDKAKKTLGSSFTGEGKTIGPYFLMNTFFDLANYKGNSYMKLSNEIMDKTTLVHRDNSFLVNSKLVRDLDDKSKKRLEEFLIAQYYYRNNYLD